MSILPSVQKTRRVKVVNKNLHLSHMTSEELRKLCKDLKGWQNHMLP
ncbi:41212_t:CDS:1, partial [Gigaspora margarita]